MTGAKLVRELAEGMNGSEIVYQYSPESFTGTELDYAVEICEAVCDVWEPTPDRKAIINLPATVEMATPNVYADQIEWFIRNFPVSRELRHQPPPAQRQGYRRGSRGDGRDGRGGPGRRHAVRQR